MSYQDSPPVATAPVGAPYSPYRALWARVLVHALRSAIRCGNGKVYEANAIVRNSLDYFDSADARTVCALAGIDHSSVRARAHSGRAQFLDLLDQGFSEKRAISMVINDDE